MIQEYIGGIKYFISGYGLVFLINLVLSLFIIFSERRKPVSTLLWVMAINFLPILGFVLYLFIGQDLTKSKMFDKKGKLNRFIDEIASKNLKNIKSGNMQLNPRTYEHLDMIEMFNTANQSILSKDNQIDKFLDGNEMFPRLKEDIRNAKNTVYIQSYIFKSDQLGSEIMELLKQKAREGLDVVLLVDGMGGRRFKTRDRESLKKAGVRVAIFFPGLLKAISHRINYRNHRKIIVIDGEIGYVGGQNIGDDYLGKYKRFGYWRDTHVRITGDAVQTLLFRFFQDYRFAVGEDHLDIPIGTNLAMKKDEDAEFKNADICIVSSGPDEKYDAIRHGYDKMISGAKDRIFIQTPYFVPDDGLLSSLKIAALSGVEVHIMIPRKRDHAFVHWASLSFLGELLEWGVHAYFYEGGFLHNKVVIADDYVSSLGTANFDIRSFELNFEVNAFIFDEDLNASLVSDFYRDVEKSTELTLEDYENRSWIVKAREGISRLLSPLL